MSDLAPGPVETEHPSKDEQFSSLSNHFMDWLKANDATISPKIELADLRFKQAGRGVVAKEDIEEDEDLFRIPKSSILTTSTSDISPEISGALEDPWLSLILAMIYEYQQQTHSKWEPYFGILPSTFDTLMYWSDEELQSLRGSTVVDKIGKDNANATFTTNILPLIRQHESIFSAQNLADEEILSLCHRMGSTIMAYAFDMEPSSSTTVESVDDEWEEDSEAVQPKGMIPLADMLNADATRNNALLFYEPDAVVMKTLRPISQGEELFNDYGPLPRADLLRRYGYLTDHYAPYDVVEISLDLIKDVAKREEKDLSNGEIDTVLQYLEEEDILDDGYDIFHPDHEEGQFPDGLKILLAALVDSRDFRGTGKLPKPKLSVASLPLLHAVLLERQSLYPSNRDQEMSDAGMSHRREMAAQVIAGEKAVLSAALATVSDLLAAEKKKRKAEESNDTASYRRDHPTKKTKKDGR